MINNCQLPFKVGNYWIYQNFTNFDGVQTDLNEYDSCFVSKDTLINGKSYVKYEEINSGYPGNGHSYFRDSLHYQVDSHGNISCSFEDFTTIFSKRFELDTMVNPIDTVFRGVLKMIEKDQPISVPAGNFITSDAAFSYIIWPTHVQSGTSNAKVQDTRYSKNIGLVYQSFPFSNYPNRRIGRQLIRYHIN